MSKLRKEEIKTKIELMEKEIAYYKGKQREKALKTYRELILPQLNEPIFLLRSE
ncbi:MAG: hypothetical protein P8Y18_04930 [Candidatus Bathyarchaeota archaeon]